MMMLYLRLTNTRSHRVVWLMNSGIWWADNGLGHRKTFANIHDANKILVDKEKLIPKHLISEIVLEIVDENNIVLQKGTTT